MSRTLIRASSPRAMISLAVVILLGSTSVVDAIARPQPVRVGKAKENQPAASADYLAWVRYTRNGHSVVWAMAYGDQPFRVSPKGVDADLGGIDGSTLVYQETSGTGSDIYFFDLETKERTSAPGRINTERWEYHPSISGDWVLFGRSSATGASKILLYDTATDELRALKETSTRVVDPGQVNGNYAVWEMHNVRWGWGEVFVYDIDADTRIQVPNPDAKTQFGPSVNVAGAVFYGRNNGACGRHVTLNAYPIGGPAETLISFRAGWDFYSSYAVDNSDGSTDVFFDRDRCPGGDQDIFKLTFP